MRSFSQSSLLISQVFDDICREFGHPRVDLFSGKADTRLPIYVSPIQDLKAWKEDIYQNPWKNLDLYVTLHSLSSVESPDFINSY